jgi:hypothetical protein
MTAETQRHAGHADVVRELIDGAAGLLKESNNLPASTRNGGATTAAAWNKPPAALPVSMGHEPRLSRSVHPARPCIERA